MNAGTGRVGLAVTTAVTSSYVSVFVEGVGKVDRVTFTLIVTSFSVILCVGKFGTLICVTQTSLYGEFLFFIESVG